MSLLVRNRLALITYATTIRPDIAPADLEGALLALETAGWTWTRIVSATHLMLTNDEEPRDLRNAIRDPTQQRRTHLNRTT